MAITGNKVKFVYVSPSGSLPSTRDGDTVYFVESTKQLYVGSKLIADSIDISGYKVKSVTMSGAVSGNLITGASFDQNTGVLTLTKGNLVKGTDTTGTDPKPGAGGTITVVTNVAVSGKTITPEKTTITLPDDQDTTYTFEGVTGGFKVTPKGGSAQTVSIGKPTTAGTADKVVGTLTIQGNSTNIATYDGHEDVTANITPANIGAATAAQGVKADNAMPKSGGTFTGAVTLQGDPSSNLQAATKQYVDSAVAGLTGAMHFIGTSTTAITDGGTQKPTIGGNQVNPKSGDVVLYNNQEFIYNGSAWELFGDEGSYALKTRKVSAGTGLSGGGDLTADRTISHAVPSGAGTANNVSAASRTYINSITFDDFGHVTAVGTGTETDQSVPVTGADRGLSVVSSKVGHSNTAVTALTTAALKKVKYDAYGHITGTADVAASDIPNLPASKITSGTFADARIASASTWNGKQDALVFNTAYNAETNKVATMADVNTSSSGAELVWDVI